MKIVLGGKDCNSDKVLFNDFMLDDFLFNSLVKNQLITSSTVHLTNTSLNNTVPKWRETLLANKYGTFVDDGITIKTVF